MDEEWKVIKSFPRYSVSNHGDVRRDATGRIIQQNANQFGVAYVGLMRGRTQFTRSVALMVARAFVERPLAFDTPINLDGDRFNNRVDNLVWRPRWFAVQYNRQFREPYPYPIVEPLRDIATGFEYANSFEAAVTFGLLEKDIVLSILNNTYAWPTYHFFEVVV